MHNIEKKKQKHSWKTIIVIDKVWFTNCVNIGKNAHS